MNKIEKGILDFIAELGNNIATITYNTTSEQWSITYKNGLPSKEVEFDDLIEFLRNA